MSVKTGYDHGQFCWVDLNAHDMEAAKDFYCNLFGWKFAALDTQGGPPYGQFELNGHGVAGVGQMSDEMKAQGIPPLWNSYINVDSVEETSKKVEELGGKVIMPPMQVLEAGWLAFLQDPSGGNVGLWQRNQHFGAELVNDPGSFCWNELSTRDTDAAIAFYEKLFGWKCEDHPNPKTKYYLIKQNGNMNGGMIKMTEEWGEMPPSWMVYFNVSDINATLNRLKDLGGKVCMPPIEIEVGPFTVVTDPQGGCFSLIQLKDAPN